MKKYLYMLFSVFVFFLFLCYENVYAVDDVCATHSDKCTIQTYQYDKDGVSQHFSLVLGFVHNNDINNGTGTNEQYIITYDNYCNKCSEGQPCKEYCSKDKLRFITTQNEKVSMPVNYNTVTPPTAICAFPRVNSELLNDSMNAINSSNVANYVYYTDSQISNAINNGYCNTEDIYYYEGPKSVCNNKKKIDSFIAPSTLTKKDLKVNSTSAGVSICTIRFSKDGFNKTVNNIGSSILCVPENYDVSCQSIPGAGYECSLYTCNNNDGTDLPSTKDVGKECELKNIANNLDILSFNYTYDKDQFGVNVDAILENGNPPIDGSVINIGDEEYAIANTCPAYVYKIVAKVEGKTKVEYRIFSTEAEKQTYDKNNPFLSSIAVKYKFYNSSDVGILTEDELHDDILAGTKFGSIDWGNKIEVSCKGIIGQDALDFINEIFRWIQIIAPIFVIVISGVEFGGAVLLDDKDALKKASSKLIKRLIIAVALFFVPMIMSFILDVFNEASGSFASTCGIGE